MAKNIQDEAAAHMIARATLGGTFTELEVTATAVYQRGKRKGLENWLWGLP